MGGDRPYGGAAEQMRHRAEAAIGLLRSISGTGRPGEPMSSSEISDNLELRPRASSSAKAGRQRAFAVK